MKPNNLIKAALVAGVSVGLAFAPVAYADPSSESPTGQQGFFVPGINGGTDPQRYVNPLVPFPFHTVDYQRNVFPVNGFSSVDVSVAAGVASLVDSIKQNGTPYEEFGDFVHITCYGHGCAVVHKVKPAFNEGGELEDYVLYEVTTFRDAANGDGGIYTKMPKMPGFTPVNQDDYQDAVVEQTITYRYDLVSDAPDKPGLLAFLNSLAAAALYGDDYGFDQLQDAIDDGRVVTTVTTNEDGSTRVHYLVDDPDPGLPLTHILRVVGLGQLADGLDKVLKPHIDNRYDKGPNPDVNQREVSTVNGVPVTPPPVEEEQESEEPAEQSSFSAPDDNQLANRSAAMSGPVGNEAEPSGGNVVNQDNSPQGSPVGNGANSANNATQTETVDQPVKKTWKERQAERKAERDAKKAERQAEREAKKAERQQRREERKQDVQTTVNDNLSSSGNDDGANDGNNNDNGGGDGNGSSGGTGDGGSES